MCVSNIASKAYPKYPEILKNTALIAEIFFKGSFIETPFNSKLGKARLQSSISPF